MLPRYFRRPSANFSSFDDLVKKRTEVIGLPSEIEAISFIRAARFNFVISATVQPRFAGISKLFTDQAVRSTFANCAVPAWTGIASPIDMQGTVRTGGVARQARPIAIGDGITEWAQSVFQGRGRPELRGPGGADLLYAVCGIVEHLMAHAVQGGLTDLPWPPGLLWESIGDAGTTTLSLVTSQNIMKLAVVTSAPSLISFEPVFTMTASRCSCTWEQLGVLSSFAVSVCISTGRRFSCCVAWR